MLLCAGSISAYTNISNSNNFNTNDFVAVPYDDYLEIESNLSNCWNTVEANEILIRDKKEQAWKEFKEDVVQYAIIVGEFIIILLLL